MAHYSQRNKRKANNSSPPQQVTRTITNNEGVEKKVVVKAASNKELAVSRFAKKQKSYNGLRMVGGQIYEESKRALRYPEAYNTYNKMMLDESVSLGYSTKKNYLWMALNNYSIELGESESKAAEEAKEFIEYCFNNLDQSWYEICSNITTYSKYGFSLLEMVPTTIQSGKYVGRTKFKRLSPISAKSIDEWVMSEDQSTIYGVAQSTSYLNSSNTTTVGGMKIERVDVLSTEGTEIFIPYNRLLHWTYNAESGNPIGESQFKYCYTTWLEKQTISEYECVGISKDMSGVLEVKIPAEVLNKAALDPESPEGIIVEKMITDAANVTANEQAYFLNPSDWHEDGKAPMYSMDLKGIQGGGKSFNLNEVIQRKRKAILDTFGVGFIALGENGAGSYAQADTGSSNHLLSLESDLHFIVDQFNKKLIPTLLALNGILLDEEDMPTFSFGSIEEPSSDTVSKEIQRVFAVNGIPRTKEVIIHYMKKLGMPTSRVSKMDDEEIWEFMGWNPETNKMQSRSGDGMAKGSGNGTSDNVAGRDNSTSNNENMME